MTGKLNGVERPSHLCELHILSNLIARNLYFTLIN